MLFPYELNEESSILQPSVILILYRGNREHVEVEPTPQSLEELSADGERNSKN